MTDPRRAVDDETEPPEPPRLRALRRLVTALTASLILGVAVVAAAMVLRLAGSGGGAPGDALGPLSAERIALPEGETIVAVGGGGGRLLVATRDRDGRERIRAFDPSDGAPGPVVAVDRVARDGAGD